MTEQPEVVEYSLPDITYRGPVLDVPDPPTDLPYAQHEDFAAAELLQANGIEPSVDAVIDALSSEEGVLLHAAAHVAGARGYREAIPALQAALGGPDDQAGVEAAYALARLGDPAGEDALLRALGGRPDVALAPVLAAGYLAQLGRPDGAGVIAQALESPHMPTRMLACKQLLLLQPLQIRDDGAVDTMGLFRKALGDENASVVWRALEQIRYLDEDAIAVLLGGAAETLTDPANRKFARRILSGEDRR